MRSCNKFLDDACDSKNLCLGVEFSFLGANGSFAGIDIGGGAFDATLDANGGETDDTEPDGTVEPGIGLEGAGCTGTRDAEMDGEGSGEGDKFSSGSVPAFDSRSDIRREFA